MHLPLNSHRGVVGGFQRISSASAEVSYIWATSMFCLHSEALASWEISFVAIKNETAYEE